MHAHMRTKWLEAPVPWLWMNFWWVEVCNLGNFFWSMAFCCSLTVVPSQTAAVVTLVLLPWISAKPFSSSYWCWHDNLKVFQSILRLLGSMGVCLKIIQKSPHLPASRAWGWRRPFFWEPSQYRWEGNVDVGLICESQWCFIPRLQRRRADSIVWAVAFHLSSLEISSAAEFSKTLGSCC